MSNPGPNKMVSCPYNKSHQIEHYRLHIHLQKCRKSYRNCNKVLCPFDSTHVVNDVELDHHVSTCPKRDILDSKMYVMDSDYRPEVQVQQAPAISCDENWDDVNTTSYIPDLAKKGSHIIAKAHGATPSERRKARMEGIANYKPQN